jgi:hypothetical protein
MRTRRVLAGIALAASLVGACTSDEILSSLAPFPCAKDQTCPDGYTCEPDGGGCIQSYLSTGGGSGGGGSLNAVCSSQHPCSQGECWYGVCVPTSHPGNGPSVCDQGRVVVSGNCFLDCSSSQCPSQLTCTWVQAGSGGNGVAKVCISPAQAAVQNSPCSGGPSSCPYYGITNLYSCEDYQCVLPCYGGAEPCPPGTTCTSPAGDSQTGCFATD